ncbi:MAG: ABC transporter permease [Lachnospiraceae bacterium]|nr:ABC transporter permease [Lachnospiraceae bacterium]
MNKQKKSFVSELLHNQMIIPIAAILLLVIFNLISDPSFFAIKLTHNNLGNPILSGNLISVIDFGSELAILAIGMTLVTAASGGQDISVGAGVAIAGSLIFKILRGNENTPAELHAPIILAFLAACLAGMACGAFNGVLVAIFKIQPMVATLILFTAGRSIASWINMNANIVINDQTFAIFGGFIPGIPVPTPVFIAILCIIVAFLVLKFTNLGLYTQAVGINESSSRLNGLNTTLIKWVTFVILGLCVAVVSLIKVSRTGQLNYNGIAKNIEMDAILAVALGGNALSGGKFNLGASILGAYAIQFLTTTLLKLKISSEALPAYKAVVVILLVVISAPTVREKLSRMANKMKSKKS